MKHDPEKARTYAVPFAVTLIIGIGSAAVVPTAAHITFVASTVPILSAPLIYAVTEAPTPDSNRLPRVVARGMGLIWWFWVVYSSLWYHHRDIWYSGLSVFLLSFCCLLVHMAMWSVRYIDEVKQLPESVRRYAPAAYVTAMSLILIFAHKYAVLHTLGPTEIVLRSLAFACSCWFDLIAALIYEESWADSDLIFFYASKTWIFYVHSLFIPLVVVTWLATATRISRGEQRWHQLGTEKDSDAGVDDGETAYDGEEYAALPSPPEATTPAAPTKRYMFQSRTEEETGRRTAVAPRNRLMRQWGAQPSTIRADPQSLMEAAAGCAPIGAPPLPLCKNPFDALQL